MSLQFNLFTDTKVVVSRSNRSFGRECVSDLLLLFLLRLKFAIARVGGFCNLVSENFGSLPPFLESQR